MCDVLNTGVCILVKNVLFDMVQKQANISLTVDI